MKISLFCREVAILDYAYLDDHLGVVGNSLKVNLELIGRTDEEGVIFDFSKAKHRVKKIIDNSCDHRLLVPSGLIEVVEDDFVQLKFSYGSFDEFIEYQCPAQAICELPAAHISKAGIETFLENIILKEMPETIDAVKIELLQETLPSNKVSFHYTHGLKEHYGNCQFLFHGHKNTIDVEVNGVPASQYEYWLAEELFKGCVHFCKWENVANKDEIMHACREEMPEGRFSELPPVEIAYQASQGQFRGVLPGRAVYFLQEESTVENLCMHFARLIKSKVKESDIVVVRAFEGIAKGAKATL